MLGLALLCVVGVPAAIATAAPGIHTIVSMSRLLVSQSPLLDLEMTGSATQTTPFELEVHQFLYLSLLDKSNIPRHVKEVLSGVKPRKEDEANFRLYLQWIQPRRNVPGGDCPNCLSSAGDLTKGQYALNHLPLLQVTGDAVSTFQELVGCVYPGEEGTRTTLKASEMAAALALRLYPPGSDKKGSDVIVKTFATMLRGLPPDDPLTPLPKTVTDPDISICHYVRSALREKGFFPKSSVTGVQNLVKLKELLKAAGVTEIDTNAQMLYQIASLTGFITRKKDEVLDTCEQQLLGAMVQAERPAWNLEHMWNIELGTSAFGYSTKHGDKREMSFKMFQRLIKTIDFGNMVVQQDQKYEISDLLPPETLPDDVAKSPNYQAAMTMFHSIAGKKTEVSMSDFQKFVATLCGGGITPQQSKEMFHDIHGEKALRIQEFYRGIVSVPKLLHPIPDQELEEGAKAINPDSLRFTQDQFITYMVLLYEYAQDDEPTEKFPQFAKKNMSPLKPKREEPKKVVSKKEDKTKRSTTKAPKLDKREESPLSSRPLEKSGSLGNGGKPEVTKKLLVETGSSPSKRKEPKEKKKSVTFDVESTLVDVRDSQRESPKALKVATRPLSSSNRESTPRVLTPRAKTLSARLKAPKQHNSAKSLNDFRKEQHRDVV
jgi:hypothetical protein